MNRFFARTREIALLDEICASGRPEFVAVYGRRRVGKTHLIREYFKASDTLYIEFTGQKDAALATQLHDFKGTLERTFYGDNPIPKLDSWSTAFNTLAAALQATIKRGGPGRVVIFLDELPWMATHKSGLIQTLDHFWNTQLSKMPEVVLIVCGSAASWMIDNLIQAKGGLHNRLTRQMRLLPFTLPETVGFLKSRGINPGLRAVIEIYMAIGGIPHYLNQVVKGQSASQNIANLCFSESGFLRTEFTQLFRALFGESDIYERIVRTLATKRRGVDRTAILSALMAESGGSLNRRLRELEEAGFIARMTPYGKKKKDTLYRLIDPYVYFYLSWIERAPGSVFRSDGAKYWLDKARTPAWLAWAGYSFENLCLTHSTRIQTALGLDHVSCEVGSWSYSPPSGRKDLSGAQIDMLFDRSDGVITLCEIKFSNGVLSLDKANARDLVRKAEVFQSVVKTQKEIQLALITLDGFKPNTWSEDLINVSLDAKKIFAG
jgi:uncharacterized protein